MSKKFFGFFIALIIFIAACGGNVTVRDNSSSSASIPVSSVPAEQVLTASSEKVPEVEDEETKTSQPSGKEKSIRTTELYFTDLLPTVSFMTQPSCWKLKTAQNLEIYSTS